eukprot:GHVS01013329.1.p1 GENE.GHVS01013329.1~~GHVS01013329.1.p1  ORF type:complete len:313 (-),score=32.42 GHVS01013329.1:21-959(-)
MLSQLCVKPPLYEGDHPRVSVEEDINVAVYYIYTEGMFPVERLREIIASQVFSLLKYAAAAGSSTKRRRSDTGAAETSWLWKKACEVSTKLLDLVFIEEISSDVELWEVLHEKIPKLLRQYRVSYLPSTALSAHHHETFVKMSGGWVTGSRPCRSAMPCFQVKLIAVDSIAALFRLLSDNTRLTSPLAVAASPCLSTDYIDRSFQLYRMASLLSRIATQYACWMVVTNQVTANVEANGTAVLRPLKIRAALGLAWSNCVCCRIMLQRNDGSHQQEQEGRRGPRTMQVLYAPHLPPSSAIPFAIDLGGLVACN